VLYIEVLFVHGLNDTDEEIAVLNRTLTGVRCERIDIGTIDRPPAYPGQGVSYGELRDIPQKFDPELPIHIASRQHAESCTSSYSETEILNTLDKRPLTPEDIALLFNDASRARLQGLVDAGSVILKKRSGVAFYLPVSNVSRKRCT
jgi:wyosine [tRNA(Phe)-imidazoG37] synthetase (radical SAM superfamily)